MKLLKKIVVFTLGLFTLVGLASCGNKEEVDYSNLTFEEVFEIQERIHPSGAVKFAPGLTMAQLRSKTLDGAHEYYEYMSFDLKTNYKVRINSVTFSMATNEKEFTDYHIFIYKSASEKYVDEIIKETTPTITKTFKFASTCTLSANTKIGITNGVSLLNTNVGKCTIYNFSFDFEVLGK